VKSWPGVALKNVSMEAAGRSEAMESRKIKRDFKEGYLTFWAVLSFSPPAEDPGGTAASR